MADLPQHILRLSDLATRKPTAFALKPDAAARAAIARALDLDGLHKLTLTGEIAPVGQRDWALTARLGATVVQPCVATLVPVTTRIDEDVSRAYISDLPEYDDAEIEMPEDDSAEPLPASVDVANVMIEALSLAVPSFPRAEGAQAGQIIAAEPGVTPMTDDDAKPFAGLGALRDALKAKGEDDV